MRSTLTTVTFAATLCLALCGLSVRSAITIQGIYIFFISIFLFYLSIFIFAPASDSNAMLQ